MATFTDLPLHLQEKIIKKLKLKSYCRLQQTCKQLAELFQTDKHLVLHRGYRCTLEHRTLRFLNKQYKIELDRQCFYGIAFKDMLVTIDNEWHFDGFCNRMEECRTTCTKLSIFDVGTSYQSSREQCEKLLGILKPTAVHLNSCASDRFESVFSLKKIMDIDLTLNFMAMNMLSILERFFARFRKVAISMRDPPIPQRYLFPFIKSVLELLNSTNWPHLREFSYASGCDYWSLSVSDSTLLEEFDGFQPAIEDRSSSVIRMSCPIRQHETHCSVKFMNSNLLLFYRV